MEQNKRLFTLSAVGCFALYTLYTLRMLFFGVNVAELLFFALAGMLAAGLYLKNELLIYLPCAVRVGRSLFYLLRGFVLLLGGQMNFRFFLYSLFTNGGIVLFYGLLALGFYSKMKELWYGAAGGMVLCLLGNILVNRHFPRFFIFLFAYFTLIAGCILLASSDVLEETEGEEDPFARRFAPAWGEEPDDGIVEEPEPPVWEGDDGYGLSSLYDELREKEKKPRPAPREHKEKPKASEEEELLDALARLNEGLENHKYS